MGAYAAYFDCSAAHCELAVTNIMGRPAAYHLRIFNRSGASLVDEERILPAHASERVNLNDLAAGQDGQILVVPVNDEDDDFPAMLILAGPGAEAGAPSRFLPLTRIDDMPDEDDDDDDDEDDDEDDHDDDEKHEVDDKESRKGKTSKGGKDDDD